MATDLREQRLAAGLSQQRVAELAECSVQMVRVLESGMRPTTSAVLSRIEAVLAAHDAAVNSTGDTSAEANGRAAA